MPFTQEELYQLTFTLVNKIKSTLKIAGFKDFSDLGLFSTIKENFEFTSGVYLFDKPDAYTLKLIEPFFQQNQTKKTKIGINPGFLENIRPGENFNLIFEAVGGQAPYTFAAIESTEVFEETVTILAQDATATIIQNFIIPISENPGPLQIVTTNLKTADQEENYEFFLNGGGGTGNFTWGLFLKPSWLNIDASTGRLFGIVPPNTRGISFVVVVTLSDGNSQIEQTYNLRIEARSNVRLRFLSPTRLPNAVLDRPYSQIIQLEGGTGSPILTASKSSPWIQFNPQTRILSGLPSRTIQQELTLPTGMSLTSEGAFFGSITNRGLYNFNIRATDNRGIYQDQFYSWLITTDSRSSVTFKTSEELPPAKIDTFYSTKIEAQGGFPPYTFTLFENSILPTGLTLNLDGTLTGTTTLFSTAQKIHQPFYIFKILVKDSQNNQRVQQFKFTVLPVTEQSLFNLPAFSDPTLKFRNAFKFKYDFLKHRKTAYAEKELQEAQLNLDFSYAPNGNGTLKYSLKLPNVFTTKEFLQENPLATNFLSKELIFTSIENLQNNLLQQLVPLINLLKLQGTIAPTIKVTYGATQINIFNNETIFVAPFTTLADLNLKIFINDEEQQKVQLKGTFTGITTEGFLTSQFSNSLQLTPYIKNPLIGQFNQPNALIIINLEANDLNGGITYFSFKIQVGT